MEGIKCNAIEVRICGVIINPIEYLQLELPSKTYQCDITISKTELLKLISIFKKDGNRFKNRKINKRIIKRHKKSLIKYHY